MKLTLWRIILAPLTSWRALRLRREANKRLSFDAAWRRARMLAAPDEMVYRLHGHQFPIDYEEEDGPGQPEWSTYRLP
ncbi:hypothetical protein OG982_29710 [Streptomyces sp. NBC_01551]|uniref:hypothetical protein n=1 Tax=Streptomyces sp. NBC_01551 TaxID=2975876 RepID=UPI0022518499|nr:hypothetical protein [Streptomyces sp. NBC_01551]MCX4529825.1 hypothetical protein [Streptomyces sp. NBC_01551]